MLLFVTLTLIEISCIVCVYGGGGGGTLRNTARDTTGDSNIASQDAMCANIEGQTGSTSGNESVGCTHVVSHACMQTRICACRHKISSSLHYIIKSFKFVDLNVRKESHDKIGIM